MNFGQGAPATAHSVENRPSKRWSQIVPQQLVNSPFGLGNTTLQQRFNRQGSQRQAGPVVADMIVQGLGDLEAAAPHVADQTDRTEKAGNDTKCRIACFLHSLQNAHGEPRCLFYCRDQFRAIAGPPDRLGGRHVDAGNAHGIGNRAESAKGLDSATEPLRGDGPGLRQAISKAAQRLLDETRQRCTTQLVIDNHPHRVGANVDDGIVRLASAARQAGTEIERAGHRFPGSAIRSGHGNHERHSSCTPFGRLVAPPKTGKAAGKAVVGKYRFGWSAEDPKLSSIVCSQAAPACNLDQFGADDGLCGFCPGRVEGVMGVSSTEGERTSAKSSFACARLR